MQNLIVSYDMGNNTVNMSKTVACQMAVNGVVRVTFLPICARTLTGRNGTPTVLFETGQHRIKASAGSDFVGLHETYTYSFDKASM